VPHVRTVREAVPPHVEEALERVLAKTPADRIPTAAEFTRALAGPLSNNPPRASSPVLNATGAGERVEVSSQQFRARAKKLALAVALAIAGVGALFAWRLSHIGDAGANGTRRLAVLPFDNLGDSSQMYFADGLAGEIRGKLAALPNLEVIATASSGQYRGRTKPTRQIGRELGVRYLLVGRVQWDRSQAGNGRVARVRVSPELVDAATGATAWEQPFDAPLTDVFAVQAEIAERVARALGVRLGVAEAQQLAARPTSDIVAYDAYLRAEVFTRRFETGEFALTDSAIKYYREAVARDSNFARAWAKLAGAESVNFINYGRPPGGAGPIHAILSRVEHLAPEAPETAFLRSQVAYNVDADTAKAFAVIRTALERFPGDAEIIQFASALQLQVGQFDAALAYAKRGLELDPKSVQLASLAGMTAVMARRYVEARLLLDKAEQMQAGSSDPTALRVASYLGEGDTAGARRTLLEAQHRFSPEGFTQVALRWANATWLLDSVQRQEVLRAPLAGFDGFASSRALTLMDLYDQVGDSTASRQWADSVLAATLRDERTLGKTNPYLPAMRAIALSRLGRYDSAFASVKEAVRRSEANRIGFIDPAIRLAVARVLMRAGRSDEAVARLKEVLRVQYMVSAAWLAIDPTWKPLRNNPSFGQLVQGT
jgi:TolB-like protein